MQGERGTRGQRFSAYVGDKTPEERAFWDAAEDFIIKEGERAGKIEWAAFFRYLSTLVLMDRQGKAPRGAEEPGELHNEVRELSKKVSELERIIKTSVIQPEGLKGKEPEENELTKTVESIVGEDWT